MAEAREGLKGSRARLAERDAVFAVLEKHGLVVTTRGGRSPPNQYGKSFCDHYKVKRPTAEGSADEKLGRFLIILLAVLPPAYVLPKPSMMAQTVFDLDEVTGDLRIIGPSFGTGIANLVCLDFNVSGSQDLFIGGHHISNNGVVRGFFDFSLTQPNQVLDLLEDPTDLLIYGDPPWGVGDALLAVDMNLDGLEDLVLSDETEGEVYVLFGSPSWQVGTVFNLASQPADLTIIGEYDLDFGSALAAGDLNADGHEDLAIGAFDARNPIGWFTGAVFVIYASAAFPPHAVIDLQIQPADITLYGARGNDDFGEDLDTGDVNGDGVCDLIIGAGNAFNQSDFLGRAYVLYGSNSFPACHVVDLRYESADVTIKGPHWASQLGLSVAVGDVNGDGLGDILAGALGYHGNFEYAGRAYAIWGRPDFPPDLVIDLAVEEADLTCEGEMELGKLGRGMSAGDMDGDGIDEWAISADAGERAEEFEGICYLLEGTTEFSPEHTVYFGTNSPLYRIPGDDPLDGMQATSDMADLNGDGLEDLVLGAYNADRPGYNGCGEIYVILGRQPLHSPPRVLAGPGPQPSNPLVVRVYDPYYHEAPIIGFRPYLLSGYGTVVAAGDLDGDGYDETLTGPGPGPWHPPVAAGFDYQGHRLFQFRAYGARNYGVNVAAGDIDADGREEILTGPGPGIMYGPHVRGWEWQGGSSVTPLLGVSFLAYSTLQFGVNVAAGDIDGDGREEILTGPGPGSIFGPHVRGWKDTSSGTTQPIPGVNFMAYGTHNFGVNVAAGDIDGDGMAEILTAPGPGAMFSSNVRGWNYDGVAVSAIPGVNFIAFADLPYGYGASVVCADLDNDRVDEILTAPGPRPDNPPELRAWNYDGVELTLVESKSFLVFEPGLYQAGARIAGGNFYQYPPYLP